jgi:hypothetical protein
MTRTASAHGLTSPRAADWRDRSACLGEDPEIFFANPLTSLGALEAEQAKTICGRCPSQDACLQFALDNNIGDGIYGGLTEDERHNLRRREARNARHPVQHPRGPKLPPPASMQELFDRHANPATGGHLMWIGAKTPIFRGRQLTPGQVAFMADRGREPDGPVQRTCGVSGCVQPKHLADDEERSRCGTRLGYRRHLANGETPCDPCRRANADADNRLRWTGTTKAAVPA